MQWVIGVDEAGRGALAGPVCVGTVLYPSDFDWREGFALVTKRGEPRLRDSKQLSAQQRDILYKYVTEHGRLRHAAGFASAETIDVMGIVNAAREATAIALKSLAISPERAKVLLDAGLSAPRPWEQESFVRGDENIPAIAFASIIAKVTRDRHMEQLSEMYANYGFEQHKGYGTKGHFKAIKTYGVHDVHRTTFLSLQS